MATLQELQNAGLPALTTDGGVNASFSRSLTESENLLFLSMVDQPRFRELQARIEANAIPNWATWTQPQWTTYFNANLANGHVTSISNLADAKLMLAKQNNVIDALAKMVIALRNRTRIIE